MRWAPGGSVPVRSAGQRRVAVWVARHRRFTTRVYAAAAVLLVPWIVALAIIQPATAIAHRVRGLAVASMVVTAAALLVAAWSSRRRPDLAALAATSACTVAVMTSWFHVVTLQLGSDPLRSVVTGVVLAIVVGVGVRAVTTLRRGRTSPQMRAALVIAAVLCLVPIGRTIAVAPAVASADHLKTAWVGLDVAELAGLIATAVAVARDRTWLVIAGAVTGTLLLLDAVVNVATEVGLAQVSALVMCLVELPLGVGALLLAWSVADRDGVSSSATVAADDAVTSTSGAGDGERRVRLEDER